MRNRFLAALATVVVAGGTLVAASTASSAASLPPCTTYKQVSYGSSMRMVPVNNGSTNCYLVNGNQGKGVWALQMALKKCNYKYNLTADSSFGRITETAVTQLQRKKGITADGDYGSQTRSKMSFYGGEVSTGPICNKA